MGLWKDFWASRRAKYQAAALREQAEVRRQQRRAELASKPSKSASELVEQQLLESTSEAMWGGWDRANLLKGDLDRLMDFQRSGFGFGGGGVTSHEGKRGADYPFFNSETQFFTLVDTSRLVVGTNDNAKGLLGGNRRYTLGSGATVRIVPRTAKGKDEAAKAQAVVDEHMRRNNFAHKQREFFDRNSRDGEGIFRLFPYEDGTADLRFVWTEQIKQPRGNVEGDWPDASSEFWSYGRLTDENDIEKTHAWAVYPTVGPNTLEPDIVPELEVVYQGLNADTGVKRSIPDFCLCTADMLESAGRLAENMGIGSAIQAAIALIRQHEVMPRETIRGFATSDASYTKPDVYTGNTINVKRFLPGTVVDMTKNTAFQSSPYNAGIMAHLEVFMMLTRRAHARWNAPQWLGTSYAEQTNFASAFETSSPYVLTILEMQSYYAATFTTLFERVLAIAAAADKLPKNILDLVEVKVTLPNPQSRDKLQEAQRAQIRLTNGTTSPQRVAEEDGDEWEEVQKERADAMAQGWTPPAGSSGNGVQAPAPGGGPGGNFTGTIIDANGHERRYVNGRQVGLAESKESGGRWITIGGKSEGGKRSGGCPVFIQNGRITKGHPSLVGKKIDNLKDDEDVEHGSHRQQLNRSKAHEKASWRKRARQAGHDPRHLDELAAELKAHHDAFADERTELLKTAREHSKANGFGDLQRRGKDGYIGGKEDNQKGFDQTTEHVVGRYPHHFRPETGEHGSHEDQLRDMLSAGNPEKMSHAQAYEQAFDLMMEHPPAKKSSDYPPEWDDPIPD